MWVVGELVDSEDQSARSLSLSLPPPPTPPTPRSLFPLPSLSLPPSLPPSPSPLQPLSAVPFARIRSRTVGLRPLTPWTGRSE